MNTLRKIQILSGMVIANSAAAIALLSPVEAQATACGTRWTCGHPLCSGTGPQYVCSSTLPAGCTSSTPLQCNSVNLGPGCYSLVQCQDQ